LVGTNPATLLQACRARLLGARPQACAFDADAPFGDGNTAQRVLTVLASTLEKNT
jgi:hypothetical protein